MCLKRLLDIKLNPVQSGTRKAPLSTLQGGAGRALIPVAWAGRIKDLFQRNYKYIIVLVCKFPDEPEHKPTVLQFGTQKKHNTQNLVKEKKDFAR